MKNDSVTIAFEIILDEIKSVVNEVNSQGGDFFKADDYDKARALMETGKKLHEFHQKLHELKLEWVSGLDEPTRRQVKVDADSGKKSIATAPKLPKTGLLVTFPDGTNLNCETAAETFAMAIGKLGFQRVINLGKSVNGLPLVAKKKQSSKYSSFEFGGHFIVTHSNTESKCKMLKNIAGELNENIGVHVVP